MADVQERWRNFFGDQRSVCTLGHPRPYRAVLEETAATVSPYKSILVNFLDVERRDTAMADDILAHPDRTLAEMTEAASERAGERVHVRLANVPSTAHHKISSVREDHIGCLVAVRGVVQSASETRGEVTIARFRCARCSKVVTQPQDDPLLLTEPIECAEDQGGCGRKTAWTLVSEGDARERSVRVDLQVFTLQELPETVTGTRTPERIPCHVRGDWCGRVRPAERVTVTGILRGQVKRVGGKRTRLLEYHVDVSSFETEQTTYEDITPTPDEVTRIEALSRHADLRDMLVGSVAPSVHGRREVKLAILLQLFGGVHKTLPDGQEKRGDVHVLLIGDPGTGKSVLGRAAVQLSPRGQTANALTASVAGVVGGVEKMERGLGGEAWVYTAGLVTMVDRGFLFVDEADKAKDKDLINSLLEPLEQQTASLTKMGARGLTLQCRFSALFVANPKNGRFDPNGDDLASQIELPSPLLDRMDLVFILDDKDDLQRDGSLVDTLLAGHVYGQADVAHRLHGTAMSLAARAVEERLKPALDADFLRKYIAHARRTITPRLSEEAMSRIRGKYMLVRGRRGENPNAPTGYSARTVDALVRLAEAAARMRLSSVIEDEDMDLAFDVFEAGWERLARNAKGELDMDRVGSPTPKTMRDTMRLLISIVDRLRHEDGGGAREDEIMAAAVSSGIQREAAMNALQRMKTNGTLLPWRGGWVTSGAKMTPVKRDLR